MAPLGLRHRFDEVLRESASGLDDAQRELVREFVRLVIQVLARSELTESETDVLVSSLCDHFDLDLETVRPLVLLALRPEHRSVVDKHEIQAFQTRFGGELSRLLEEEESDLPGLPEFATKFGGSQALMLLDTVFAVSGADGEIDSMEVHRLQVAASDLRVDDVLVSALIAKHDPRHLDGDLCFPLEGDRVIIGRSSTCDICLPDPQVALRHSELVKTESGWRVLDLKSGRPTLLNGVSVNSAPMDDDSTLRIGAFALGLSEEGLKVKMERSFSSLSVRGLRRQIGNVALLDDVSFTVFTGEVVAVIGPSGCGKTTLLNAINGVTPADSGEVLLDGRDFHRMLAADRSLVGIVPQDDLVNPELTVEESLMYSGRLRMGAGVSRRELKQEVDRVLTELDIHHIRKSRIGDVLRRGISGGQRKRVNLGQELMTRSTRVLFLDEPMSGLDPRASQDIMSLTRQLADRGRIVFLVTHDLTPQVMAQVDHLLVLAPGGRLAYFGPPGDACRWFGVGTPDAIFNRFGDQSPSEWADSYRESADAEKFVQTREHLLGLEGVATDTRQVTRLRGIAAPRHFLTLTRRYLKVKLRDRMGVAVLAVQPAILALVMWVVFPAPTKTALFMLSLGALWFGMSAAVRELIVDRVIFRREYRVGVGIFPYLASKVVVMGGLVALQSLVLAWAVFHLLGMEEYGFVLSVLIEVCVTTGVMGMALSFLVSSIFDSSEAAVGSIPLLLIPQIALSGIMLDVRNMPPLAKALGWLNIERFSFDAVIKSGTHFAEIQLGKADPYVLNEYLIWIYETFPFIGEVNTADPIEKRSQSSLLWTLGFKETSNVDDKGLLLGQLVQVMNGFSGVFLVSALCVVGFKVGRDR
jgi:ABC-type multidrug transport system ATPase subunit